MNRSTFLRFACWLAVFFAASAALAVPLTAPETSWTLAIMPDTQHYRDTDTYSRSWMFGAQTQFLVDSRDTLNLTYVLHEGDITNNNTTTQWNTATAAMGKLDTAGI